MAVRENMYEHEVGRTEIEFGISNIMEKIARNCPKVRITKKEETTAFLLKQIVCGILETKQKKVLFDLFAFFKFIVCLIFSHSMYI